VIVLDASAILELLLLTPVGLRIADRVFTQPAAAHAPELIDLEVAQVVRRFARHGDLTEERSAAVLEDLADMRLRRYPHLPLLPRVWELRGNLTAYDAVYVALAEGLDAVLLTRDRALAEAPHRARVELL
jgi:predicted nucleic acid-binding protein